MAYPMAVYQFYSNMMGFNVHVAGMTHLFYLLRGIRRVQVATRRRHVRPAISIPQLNIIINHLRLYTSDRRDGLMLQSAVSLVFYGLLRSAEYTSPSASSYSANSTLLFSDVSINRVSKVATIFIKSSKTDPFRIGCAVRVGSTGLFSCPVMALYNFISVHPSMAGPLFTFQDGTYLTRAYVSRLIGDSLPQLPHANTHSFRIGGATAAASAGIANSTIQILGRWSSDAYRQYLRLPDSVICDMSVRISTVADTTRLWDSDLLSSVPVI